MQPKAQSSPNTAESSRTGQSLSGSLTPLVQQAVQLQQCASSADAKAAESGPIRVLWEQPLYPTWGVAQRKAGQQEANAEDQGKATEKTSERPDVVALLVECLEQEAALNDQLQRLRDKCAAEAGFRRHLEQQRARWAAEVRVLVEHLETCLQCIHNAISEYKQLDDKEAERQAEELALLTLLRQVQAKRKIMQEAAFDRLVAARRGQPGPPQ